MLFFKDFLISQGCVCTIIDSPPFVSAGSIEINHRSEQDIIKLCYFPFAVAIILSRFVMLRTAKLFNVKAKAHITYIAEGAVALQRIQHSTSQETLL